MLPNRDLLSPKRRLLGARSAGPLLIVAVLALCALATSASAALRVSVRPGDTLSAIAARHGVSVNSLVRANGLRNPDLVPAGRSLTVPSGLRVSGGAGSGSASGTYTVRPGDTLSAIAGRFGVSVGSIVRRNGLGSAHRIIAGSRLRIGSGGGTPSATAVGGSTYTVRTGDTLSGIAGKFGMSVASIARSNGIQDPHAIAVGSRLRVVEGSSAPSRGALEPLTAAGSGWGAHPSKSSVANLIAAHAARHGVDVALVRAVAWQESGWWQGARSSTGALGVMQLMPGTAAWIGPALLGRTVNAANVSDNIEAGVAYLGYLHRQTGSRRLTIASYYQGLGSVTSRGLFDDTVAYIGAVTSFLGKV